MEVVPPVGQEELSTGAIPEDYVLGPQDSLEIVIHSRVPESIPATVSLTGQIYLPILGAVEAQGLTVAGLRELLESEYSKYYTDVSVGVLVTSVPTFKVSLEGEANNPGTYTANAFTTVTELVTRSGGIAESGSRRRLLLLRADGSSHIVDLDAVVLRGAAEADRSLRPGDRIFVPFVGKLVTVKGQVRKPGTYELLDGEHLPELMEYAGGLLPSALPSIAYVDRFPQPDSPPLHIPVDLSPASFDSGGRASFALRDRDTLRVPFAETFAGSVVIDGAVKEPGTKPWRENLTLSSLVQLAAGFLPEADIPAISLVRHFEGQDQFVPISPEDIFIKGDAAADVPLQSGDMVYVPNARVSLGRVSARGELYLLEHMASLPREEGQHIIPISATARAVFADGSVSLEDTLKPGMTVLDLVQLAGGPTPEAALEECQISRVVEGGQKALERINLADIAAGRALDVPLRAGDALFVPPISMFQDRLRVVGELISVRRSAPEAGVSARAAPTGFPTTPEIIHRLRKGETVKDIVLTYGGPTPAADLQNCRIERPDGEGGYQVLPVNLEKLLNGDSSQDLPLENGDTFIVPALRSFVYVAGEVENPGPIPYSPGASAIDYVGMAGGPTERAKLSACVLSRRVGDGRSELRLDLIQVLKVGSSADIEMRPGDILIVPDVQISGWQDILALARDLSLAFRLF